ncbi:type VI secretion system Vgr family protein [Flaviaesturariibacter amylovorans]|uniref:Phage baseplate assembly protein V n=1 Tax=Flaviaesturariibacter amylovorans TaxID=1084520 RepID=A0ABP8HRD4_9BACT
MSQQIDIEITTESGKQITPFSYLTVTQQFNGHHQFELRFNHDVIEEPNTMLLDGAQAYLGKAITFTFRERDDSNYADHIFKGVVTDVSLANTVGSMGDIIFRGHSPTILLEGGPHNASFTKKGLAQIVRDATRNVSSNLMGIAPDPKFKSTVPYIVQYKESNFQFLRRLAGEYGEWFFYDGLQLCFGKPSSAKQIELKYPRDISDLKLNVRVAPVNFEQVEYSYKEEQHFTTASADVSANNLSKFNDGAASASASLFSYKPVQLSAPEAATKQELDNLVTHEKSSRVSDLVYLHAVSDSPYVRPGINVQIVAVQPDKKGETDFGTYTVTSVTHSTDGLGNYQNSFEAVPSKVTVMPNPYDRAPQAEPQLGVVKNNKDPDNLGRVQVQLFWQDGPETTPWIRVMSLHAGLRSDDSKNRGLFFTPEIDDYVIVGFHQNDPARPFVMGSVAHGKAVDSAKNSDNHIKAIRTRSGNTIYFKDKDQQKEQEIVIKTDDANIISILLKNDKGTITIKSNKAIEVHSESTINVSSEAITVKGKTIKVEASDSIEMKAKTIKMEGSQEIGAKSTNVKVEGSATVKVKASAQLDLDGGGMANLKAGLVKIN